MDDATIARETMTAADVHRRHGLGVFVQALVYHASLSAAEAESLRGATRGDEEALARVLGSRLVDHLGDGTAGEGWFRYEISEIGYNIDVTGHGYGDATEAKCWEALCERDNSIVYLTRLDTMAALAAGLLATDRADAAFARLIPRLEAEREKDAALRRRMRAAFLARTRKA